MTERMEEMTVSKTADVPSASTDLGGAQYRHFVFWLNAGATSMHLKASASASAATTSHAMWDATQGTLELHFAQPMTLYGINTTTASGKYNLLAWN